MVEHICPFCNKPADEHYVTQTLYKNRKKVQYFHYDCYEKITRRYKNGVSEQSNNLNN